MDTFAKRLRYAREQRKFSQAALARATGLSQGAISSYETGNRKSTKIIFKLAQILNVNATWLSLGTGPMDIHPHQPISPAASAQKVSDALPADLPLTNSWPFQELSETDYWSLSEQQRRMVDSMAAALVKVMHAG
ncbi:MAG: helix-turn-helix transcriptional regulator [Burkholderiaceae bacterium]|nr:helix-turn-helix transcriptional regulator [Burkholderiaceae bacterium]